MGVDWKPLASSPIPALNGSALVWLKDMETGDKWLASPKRARKPGGEYEAEIQGWDVYACSAHSVRPHAATHWLPVTAAFDLLDAV